jgi:hypothetical protein
VDRRSVQRWIARYRRQATVEALRHHGQRQLSLPSSDNYFSPAKAW